MKTGIFNTPLVRLSTILVVTTVALTSCGRQDAQDVSDLAWVQSRTADSRYAFLETRDLSDEFLFGVSVIDMKNFPSAALNVVLPPQVVSLKLASSTKSPNLAIVGDNGKPVMQFNLTKSGAKYEIDFASVGNDLVLNASLDEVGGAFTASNRNGRWISKGAPKVLKISQDENTMVVDLQHTVVQTIVGAPADNGKNSTPGQVTLRLYLMRRSTTEKLDANRSVSDGRTLNVGFFGPGPQDTDQNSPIQRFAFGDAAGGATRQETIYLKDVPANFQDVARQAVLSWNKAFDRKDALKVEIAPANLDVGDPRFNVIKWYEGLDANVTWAGVAKMMVDPKTGLVFSGNLYINGATVEKLYVGIDQFTKSLAKTSGIQMDGTVGKGSLVFQPGETPVVPFFTDLSKDYATYMQGYYLATIAHEMGHVLGLRHNFRGGNTIAADGSATSVMAYLPRANRNLYTGPGSYDLAAIKWGYFGKKPAGKLEFCTDEDMAKLYDCNQGTYGDPIDYVKHGLIDGTKVLSAAPVAISADAQIASMRGTMDSYYKMLKLSDQIPAARRATAVADLKAAYATVRAAKPLPSLTGADLQIVKANIQKLVKMADDADAASRKANALGEFAQGF